MICIIIVFIFQKKSSFKNKDKYNCHTKDNLVIANVNTLNGKLFCLPLNASRQ